MNGLLRRANHAWRSLSIPAFWSMMAVSTTAFLLLSINRVIPSILSVIQIVPISWAALSYSPRRAYAGAWLIASAGMIWLAAGGDPDFVLGLQDAILLDLVGLSLVEVLYRLARSRAEATARVAASERFFKAVMERGSDMMWVIDADTTLRYASPAALALSAGGTSPLGRSGIEFILPEDRSSSLDRLAESLRRPDEVVGEFSFRVLNGMRQVTTLSVTIRNMLADPAVYGIVVNGRDITEVIHAEEALRSSERNYRQLYLAAAEQARKLAALDHIRSAVAGAESAQALAGVAARAVSAALSQIPTAVILTDRTGRAHYDAANDSPEIRASLDAPGGFVETARQRGAFAFDADGYGRVAVPLRDGENVVGMLVAVGTPVIQVTQAEADLAAALGERIDLALTRLRLYQAIAAERDLAVSIMEAMNQPISVGPPGGKFQYTNPAYQRIVGYSREALLNMTIADIVLPENVEAIIARRTEAASGAERQAYETRIRSADGALIPVLVSYTVQPQAPPPGGVVAVLTDLTEIKRREEALQEANRALEAARDEAISASRLKSEFLATLSHEIRTPMNGILGMAELLLDTPLSRTQRDYAGVIFQSGEALMEIINGILDFSRLEAGRTQLALSAVPIRATLEQVVELMSATARTKHILLRCAVEPDCPEVIQADAGRLRQELLNLVGNAVKFTEAGKVDVRAFRAAPGRVRVEITDTGIGISPQFRDRLFMPFSQGDSSLARRHGGTGLGLAISKSLIELMGGEIGALANSAGGATFWFELAG